MSTTIAELGTSGVIVHTVCAGAAAGFSKAIAAFAISTADRSTAKDYVTLTREEGVLVALAILQDELKRKKYNDHAITEMAELLGADLKKLRAFE